MTSDWELVRELRDALRALPDVVAQEDLEPPGPDTLYVPATHIKALGLDTTVVVGMRGAGKSVWTAALFDDQARQQLIQAGAPRILETTYVRVGYSVDPHRGKHPSQEVLRSLLEQQLAARHIWRGVLARQLADVCGLPFPMNKWAKAATWARDDPEEFDDLLSRCSSILKRRESHFLLVFDSLDTMAPGSWDEVRTLARGALELALACRPYPNIRLKFFMRPDMEEDPAILDFRDSSKLLHNKVELFWRPVDLYGLVFHILANGPAGPEFRRMSEEICGVEWQKQNHIHIVPKILRTSDKAQRKVVEAMAGPYMGTNRRRGFTYTWIPGHLADAHQRVAPRSLLLAIREAANITSEAYHDHRFPLHYEAINRGVAQASDVRVQELSKEDYPWVEPLLRALRGMTVPLDASDLSERWTHAALEEVMAASADKLPPRRFASTAKSNRDIELLIDDLEELGVLYRTEDGRLNIPDIFRVGFEIRRKGGVRPLQRGS